MTNAGPSSNRDLPARCRPKGRRYISGSQAADEEFAFVDHFFGEMVVELDEEFFVVDDFVLPGGALEFLEFVEFLFRETERQMEPSCSPCH